MRRHAASLCLTLLLLGLWLSPGAASAQPQSAELPVVGPALRVRVQTAGLQRVTAAALFAAGLPKTVDPRRLQLWLNGVEVALEVTSTAADRLQNGDLLQFYAPTIGDRWNRSAVYRLSWDGAPGRRVGSRSVAPTAPPTDTTVSESGSSYQPSLYRSTQAGPDGDHWFSAELLAGAAPADARTTLSLAPRLPAATAALTLTVSGSSARDGPHQLQIAAGSTAVTVTWSGAGDFQHELSLPVAATQLTLTLQSAAEFDSLLIDRLAWQRSAQLAPLAGALFSLPAAEQHRQFSTAPAAALQLYDVTDAAAPQRLTDWRNGLTDSGPRQYLLAAAAQTAQPQLELQPALQLPAGADAVFIAPAALHSALAPLVARRISQGLQVAVVEPQTIYDGWSYGRSDPVAIRAFLQQAYATWQPRPWAVVLVGDGTIDPHNYSGRNDLSLIPPYPAEIDPWLGESACENCFVQFDSSDPRDDPLPELAISRLPVKNATQLRAVVAKLLAYDEQPAVDWRATQLYLSDNAFDAAGRPDPAGDFFGQNELLAALQPAGLRLRRIAYDPRLGAAAPDSYATAPAVRSAALAALQAGPGLVVYSGHANQWQWAVTDAAADQGYLLTLYDADTLRNGSRLPVVLALTCLSSAFQTPAYSGTTIDERLVLMADGGAAAVWGSAGMGVVHGQIWLARGFFARLWDDTLPPARLGELTLAGYQALVRDAGCCLDQIHSAVLLGDATMPLRLQPAQWLFIPIVER